MRLDLQSLSMRLPALAAAAHRPEILDLGREAARQRLVELFERRAIVAVHDVLEEQLRELLAAREPGRELSRAALDERVGAHLRGVPLEQYGRWIHFPWSGRLVHLLPEGEFRELRTDRNRYKITGEEQARLQRATIGVLGLSVGQASAVALALEGVGGRFRLADFDTLALSNLNRLRAGVHELGVNKAVLAARQMFELDPYLDIELFEGGVTPENLGAFLGSGPDRVDLLVEECDELSIKVLVRERCRALRIPVLMETSDRGLLDVERFDLEPERPLFHGLLGEVDGASLRGLPTKEKIPHVLRILGGAELSERLSGSLIEVKESLSTWPQLGSAVALGSALVTDVSRRLLLGGMAGSGRFHVDLERLVSPETAKLAEPVRPAAQPRPPEPAPELPEAPRVTTRVGVEHVRAIVARGVLASTAGNSQPWRFRWRGGALLCLHDRSRPSNFLDYEHRATYVGFGGAVENMALTAARLGLRTHVEPFPQPGDDEVVCRLHFEPSPVEPSPELYAAIPLRATNRREGSHQRLSEAEQWRLRDAAAERGGALTLLTERGALEAMGRVLGEGDRLGFLNERLHRDLFSEFRWTPGEAIRTRDGIDARTLEASPADLAAFSVVARWPAMAVVKQVNGGGALTRSSARALRAASAIGVVSVPQATREAYLQGGRAVQRVWLAATATGLAVRPLTLLTYLLARLEGGGAGLSEAERRRLSELRRDYQNLIGRNCGAELMLFAISHAAAPSVRALRRPLDEVLDTVES